MHFLSNGDYNFPFDWAFYWIKHAYMWSFQSGTPNPDGIIRLPGRIFNFIVFMLLGNVAVSYFYAISCLVIVFISFFLFARKFLRIERTSVQCIGALFFALNPIFLGNLAKVGLILAVGMLPLALMALRESFVRQRFRYLLLYILCLNISLIHPYTFTVNAAISGSYFLYLAWHNKRFTLKNVPKFAAVGVFALLLNAYFLLPIYSMGTISKDVISTNVTPVKVDYTALVGISNTGDLFTGLSLSKHVFIDFAFYNNTYQNFYYLGLFAFYVILFSLYLVQEKRLNSSQKRQLALLFGGFLVLVALATTTFLHLDALIRLLISMPGGWAFRSPLKWQLYIPVTLFGVLVVLLNHVERKRNLRLVQVGLLLTFVLMNAYLFVDIYHKLLVPRTLTHFGALQAMNLDNKTLLFVNNGACMQYTQENPRIVTELNQVFISKNVQVKHVWEDNASSVNLSGYDFVLDCKDRTLHTDLQQYQFTHTRTFVNGTFQLYANKAPAAPVLALDDLFVLNQANNISTKAAFANQQLRQKFAFVTSPSTHPTTGLTDIFESVNPQHLQPGRITIAAKPIHDGTQQLRVRTAHEPLYYTIKDNFISFSALPQKDWLPVPNNMPLKLPNADIYNVTYLDKRFDFHNLIKNPSFEQGLWQAKVADCYNYDAQPSIAMRLAQAHSDGKQSLQLEAKHHIACSGANNVRVKDGEHYLLNFDFQSLNGKFAGYYIGFDDPANTIFNERMQSDDNGWHAFTREISVPTGARSMHLMLYAYPDPSGAVSGVARYDNVNLVKIPDLQSRFYIVSGQTGLKKPNQLTYKILSPTKKLVQIRGATLPFYLTTNETFHPLWRLELANARSSDWSPRAHPDTIANNDHFALDGTMNAWYVDPAVLCSHTSGCKRNADGSLDMDMLIEFVPQRWFYAGAALSSLAFMGGLGYFVYDYRHDKFRKTRRWQWRHTQK